MSKLSRPKFKIDFGRGQVSFVDEQVFNLIQNSKNNQDNHRKLPNFVDLWREISSFDRQFLEFYSFILLNHEMSVAQLYQDLYVLYALGQKKRGTFLDFGATNGFDLSNTFLLENNFGWQGILAEPSPQWHDQLKKNRPRTKIITDCIYSTSGQVLDFFVSDVGELSTLDGFRNSSQEGNNKLRNNNGYKIKVSTVSLNDIFTKFFDSKPIDYMSVDSEGSELTILEGFDFKNFGPTIITVEHNEEEDYQKKIDNLLEKNNYRCVLKDYTKFDGWYIKKDHKIER